MAVATSSIAALFYVALVALVAGVALASRGAIERGRVDRVSYALAALGLAGAILAIVAYARSPRHGLPF